MSNVRLSSCPSCTLVQRQRTRGHAPRWMLCGELLATKRKIRHLPSTAIFSLPVSLTGARSSAPSGPPPVVHRRGQGRVPSQSPFWQAGSSHTPIVMSITAFNDPWLDNMSNCRPLEEQHYTDFFAVSTSLKTDDPPLWSGLLTPSARAAAFRENRGQCLNCREDTHS